MRRLAAIERFLERLFERPGARLFRPSIQPIQIQRKIERAMEHARRSSSGRVVVPDRFAVRLHPNDVPPDPEAAQRLAAELADAALRFAREHRYHVSERPRVELVSDPHIPRGDVDVAPDPGTGDVPRDTRPPAAGVAAAPDVAETPLRAPVEETAQYAVPRMRVPETVLRTVSPDGRERRFEIATPTVTIGRAPDNQLVLHDRRASRHHARLTARAGGLIFTDLDSTNGSVVNGKRVRELALGPGDRIELGRTVLIVESIDRSNGAS